MAEVLGILGSAIATLQLTGKLVSLGYDYLGRVKDVPSDLRQLVSELLSLSNVLLLLQDHLQNSKNSTALQILGGRNGPLRGCTLELKRLQVKLEPKAGFRGKIACLIWPLKEKETMKRISQFKRYKGLFTLVLTAGHLTLSKEIEKYVQDINLVVQNLQAESSAYISLSRSIEECTQDTNSVTHSLQTESAVQSAWMQKQDITQAEQVQKDILKWLFSGDFDTKHLEISGKRQRGTGKWLLEMPEFQSWIKEEPDFLLLWGYGIPGAGKTYLSSVVIDHLQKTQASSKNYGVAYVYFDYIEQDRQKPIHVMTSLIKQLSTQTSFPGDIWELYDKLKKEERKPTFEELYNVFLTTCKAFCRVFLIFDALDECDKDDRQGYLLGLFHRLLEANHGISIFLTSRPHPEDIQSSLHNAKKIELSAHQEDIEIYVEQKINENARAKRLIGQGKCKSKVLSELVECAKGMFLLVHFHIEHLCQQTTVRQIFAELEKLHSSGSSSSEEERPLDPTYDRAMDSIRKQSRSCIDLALRTLSWLVKAKRTLTVDEVREAVSIESDTCDLDEWDLPDETTLLDVCASLVTIDEKSKTVRLAHYTVQEYLLRNRILPEDVDFRLAAACTTYLSFDTITCHRAPRLQSFRLYPFLGYASDYVLAHLKSCDNPLMATIFLDFIEKQDTACLYGFLRTTGDCRWHCYDRKQPLQTALDIGLYSVARKLLETGHDSSPLDSRGRTPLHNAVIEDCREAVRLLLENGAETSVWDEEGMSPLHFAAVDGNKEVLRLLLQYGADISIQDDQVGLTALHMAISGGHNEVVLLLLENGANISVPDDGGQTALHLAVLVYRKNPEALNLILRLNNKADIWVQDQSGCSAFHLAASRGYDEIIQLFLENELDPSLPVQSNSGSTPLHKAALRGHKSFAQLLLRAGADISIQDNSGRTALHLAARGGQRGTFPYSSTQNNHPSIYYCNVILVLLDNGADPSVLDSCGFTAVDEAVSRGNLDALLLFLEKGADLSLLKDSGSAALYLAAFMGHKRVLGLLIEKGVDISLALDDSKRTALHLAAKENHCDVIRVLLENGADISIQDRFGRTAADEAVSGGHLGALQLFLEEVVDLSVFKDSGSTALRKAALMGHKEVLKLLIERGADIWATSDDSQRTALHEAASGGHYETVKLLLDSRIRSEVSFQDSLGQTGLHIAVLGGHYEVARVLLEGDIDATVRTKTGQTAADTAVSMGHAGILCLLSENGTPGLSKAMIRHDASTRAARQIDLRKGAGALTTSNDEEISLDKVSYLGYGALDRVPEVEKQDIGRGENISHQTSASIESRNKRSRPDETPKKMGHRDEILKRPRTQRDTLHAAADTHKKPPRVRTSSTDQNARARGA